MVAPYEPGLAAARVRVAAARIGSAWIAFVVVRMMRLAFLALALVVMMRLWFAFLAFASIVVMRLWFAFLAFAAVMVMRLWFAFPAFAAVMVMRLWFAFPAFAAVMVVTLALMAARLAATARHIHRFLFSAARFPFYFHDPAPFDIVQPLHEQVLTNDVILFGQIEFQLLSAGILNLEFSQIKLPNGVYYFLITAY
ncbi:hypothetical protein WJ0W_000100 [Paenibacillus melissococcoides]|uniref:Uncharacterized protein n=1 Tax=Paenibacillus melissococcoides TaxID=2912268 RepID=A0ABM9FUT6_9BACL|nr:MULTISPECIES: hypothetical protein [Paenibacillus]MEB9895857.1 hypothetical protein [Bacillus cereus]CAH8242891.1 hypothetical protein WJ0W_000100 [Paenibacillus melissococcoides]CAH8703339.1 hypothetical protein WDD9_000097 [Paenibacillus melissococcoides]CAH8706168.1 hypothetical protein HTL2_001181 [Paenibacillus melissococcoides]GIO82455.1 hypothetical protein J6TS7_60650 [Paenibacillus dendritiformis]